MKTFLIILIAIIALIIPFIIVYLATHWKRLIWENKKRIFRIRTDGNHWSKDKPLWVVENDFFGSLLIALRFLIKATSLHMKKL